MRLWIIGNGFDMAHGLPTKYSDYHNYLETIGEEWMANMLEFYFGNVPGYPNNILWSQLEKALGIYSIDAIYDFLKEGHTLDPDHVGQYVEEVEAEVHYHFVKICEKFTETFTGWCKRIRMDGVKPVKLFSFTKSDRFLSFNYTDTLERVYGVDDSRVLHIHGRATKSDELIIGHNRPANMPTGITDDFLDNTANIREIVKTINKLEKKVESVIQQNRMWFDSIENVDEVTVYGHSIEEVDIDYFKEVCRCVEAKAHWTFFYYDEDAINHFNEVAKELGLNENRFELVEV